VYPGAVGTGSTYAVSNDRVLHGMNPTAAGGDWPRTSPFAWKPMAMNGPAQARPPVVPTSAITGADLVVFLGSEDGHAYAANAKTGATLWQSAALGNILLASPAGMFTDFGGSWNLIFIGSRDAGAGNAMYALEGADGTTSWSFDNGGGGSAIGIISSAAYVDYTNNRLYFTSRENPSGSSNTLWCLSFTGSSATLAWARELGDIDSAATLYDGVLYVGNNAGEVYAIDPATGATNWSYATGGGAVKGFVYPQFQAVPRDVYFSTSSTVWALTDNGTSVSLDWQQGSVAGPSIPLAVPGGTAMYVGSTNGSLYQLSSTDGSVTTSVTLGDGTATVGNPVMDVINNMLYVGTESGAVYGVTVPLN
jgi:outer membrane protein assembly factor BamB